MKLHNTPTNQYPILGETSFTLIPGKNWAHFTWENETTLTIDIHPYSDDVEQASLTITIDTEKGKVNEITQYPHH